MLELLLSETAITVCQKEPQEAFIWLIPLVLVAVGGIVMIASSEDTTTKKTEGKSLGILGMPAAGKTQFLRNLQNCEYTRYEQTVNRAEYKGFEFDYNGRKIKVKEGEDIGGSSDNVKQYYKEFLESKDICVFVFDINKYIENVTYRKQVNDRLYFINEHIKSFEHWAAIGTHVDQFKIEKGKSVIEKVQGFVEGKPYSRLFNTNFFARNLTDKSDMNAIIEKLF